MVIILGAYNFYCVFLIIRLTRMYYCQCSVTIILSIFLLFITRLIIASHLVVERGAGPVFPCHRQRRAAGANAALYPAHRLPLPAPHGQPYLGLDTGVQELPYWLVTLNHSLS